MQARKAAHALKKNHIAVIVCSPLPRAHATAEIIAKKLHIKDVQVIDDLRERGLGHLEGHELQHPHEWYYTVEGEEDVEPRGSLIARCEAALAKIQKLSQQGTVLVVGHAVQGYHLQQVAAGKRLVNQFDPPKIPKNAEPIEVTIQAVQRPAVTKDTFMAFGALVAGLVCLIVGIALIVNRPPVQQTNANTGKSIPLSTDSTNTGAQLQGTTQQPLQTQTGTGQSNTDASNALQPVSTGIPNNWQ